MLPLPADSRVVLIGVSRYEHESMEALPAVEENLASLSALLTDPDVCGLPDEHCVALLNPRSTGEVLDVVPDGPCPMNNAPHLVALLRAGARFERGKLVERPTTTTAVEARTAA
jgi:hypothetical protein